jgi:DNA-binding MarR family transcriptional regulator
MSTSESTSSENAIPLDDPSRRRLPPLLRRAWYGLNQVFRRRIAHLEITPDQFTVLRWLVEGDGRGLTQRELTQSMASDPNTVTAVLNRMETAELLERKRHESDRRANRICIRPKGRARYEAARLVAIELQREVLQSLPSSRRDQLLIDLEVVADACKTAAEVAISHDEEAGGEMIGKSEPTTLNRRRRSTRDSDPERPL